MRVAGSFIGSGVRVFLAIELEGVLGVHHNLAAFLLDGGLEPGLLPLAGGLVADVEEALDAVDAVDDAAGEGGAVLGLVEVGVGLRGGLGLREVVFQDFDEFLDGEVEDVGFGIGFHKAFPLVCVSECK